jgi:hypothetical protein
MGEWGRVSKDTVKGPKEQCQRTLTKVKGQSVKDSVQHTHRVCDGVGVGWEVSQSEGGMDE